MPEIKHTFQGGKMNKDLDERLVRNGEYRHAMNVQVRTTDSDDTESMGSAGTIQNIEGNIQAGNSYNAGWMNQEVPDATFAQYLAGGIDQYPRCVASVADEKNDKAYFFFATRMTLPNIQGEIDNESGTVNERIWVDTIIEQPSYSNESIPVVVDMFGIINTLIGTVGQDINNQTFQAGWSEINVLDGSKYRVGMKLDILDQEGVSINTDDDGNEIDIRIKAIDGNTLLLEEEVFINLVNEGAMWLLFTAPRVLNFQRGNEYNTEVTDYNYITGVSIIDNLLFWTDNNSEPKKINIDRCKAGTNIGGIINDGKTHTKLYVEHPVTKELVDAAEIDDPLDSSSAISDGGGINSDLQEKHITVIRKSPTTAPTLHMKNSERSGVTNIVITSFNFINSVNNPTIDTGEIYIIENTSLENSEFRKDDILTITQVNEEEPTIVKAKFVCYEDDSGNEIFNSSDKIRIEIIASTPITFGAADWTINIERRKPLFELKLARFGYRYKYTDGEYSSFSPWSEIAFLPDRFDYKVEKAYNLGMVNTVRELIIKDFIPYNKPLDVVAVDILYKTTDSPNVYIVDTIEKEKNPEWELFTPDGEANTYEIKTGELTITSEMIHRVLDSSQTLRSWDNVPRKALAQEIIGSRLVYGNYIQGYDIDDNLSITQIIESEATAKIDNPKKSIKSLRDYKIGAVFGDKYGRETPVLTSGYSTVNPSGDGFDSLTGDISLSKTLSPLANSFVVSQTWGDPNTNVSPPEWMQDGGYVKYYVKETSSEYYNLVMDRWYDSGDNNTIWLSFNSSDRNKVDEETHLILKNKHGSEDPILEKARYKIIAIENEAPDFIKTNHAQLGIVENINPGVTGEYSSQYDSDGDGDGDSAYQNVSTIWTTFGETVAANSPEGFYENKSIKILVSAWDNSGIGDSTSDDTIFGRDIKGKIEMRVIGANVTAGVVTAQLESEWRTITHYTTSIQDDGIGEPGEFTPIYKTVSLRWDKKWKQSDVDMLLRFNAMGSDYLAANLEYRLEFRESVIENKPEFDGKFFVKIEKDFTAGNAITTFGANLEFQPEDTYPLYYIESRMRNQHQEDPTTATLAAGEDTADFSNTNWFYGAFVNFVNDTPANVLANSDLFDSASTILTSPEGASMADPTQGDNTLSNIIEDGSVISPYNQIIDSDGNSLLSPFGSCSANYNEMTIDFWKEWRSTNGNQVFIDGVNMARMDIVPGPSRNTYLDQGLNLPDTGGPNNENGKYARPLEPISKGEGFVGDYYGASSGAGSIALSWVSNMTDSEPALFTKMSGPGTYFRFQNDPEQVVYKTVGILYRSDENSGQRNWRGRKQSWFSNWEDIGGGPWPDTGSDYSIEFGIPTTFGTLSGYEINQIEETDGMELSETAGAFFALDNASDMNDCDIYEPGVDAGIDGGFVSMMHAYAYWETFALDDDNYNIRHTIFVEFRKVDTTSGTLLSTGMDLEVYDPRAHMHHDGRDSISIQIMKPSSSTLEGESLFAEKGACFETEPKESVDLDLYYEASNAIPMVLNANNAFDFAPINSKVNGFRNLNVDGSIRRGELEWSKPYINHRVNNIHFTNISNHAIVSLLSDTWNSETEGISSTQLHKEDLAINDTIKFKHNDGTVTSTKIEEIYVPIETENDGSFVDISAADETWGIVSGPKAFKKQDRTTFIFDVTNSPTIQPGNITGLFTPSNYQVPQEGLIVQSIFQVVNGENVYYSDKMTNGIRVESVTYDNYAGGWIVGFSEDMNIDWEDSDGLLYITMYALTGYYGLNVNVWDQPVKLSWHNCYSFGNGVESDRIRDDFNAPQIDNGIKVSSTFSGYKEESIGSGMIYSGLYNSTSQVNDLNEFNMSQKITKELNPIYGSIQAMKTRDTNMVVFAEDKVLRVLANKDAVFNADGNAQLTATNRVLGTATPFAGDYGISKNPESLAWDQYRLYFTDKQRGAVLRLSGDGLTPISNVGMNTWFRNHLKDATLAIGSFDKVSGEYNITIEKENLSTNRTTVSFNEAAKGWVSFKSFKPDSGVSVSGKYFTALHNKIWEHHSSEVDRTSFYGLQPHGSSVELLFNDSPSTVKSFKAINYEGSQAKITRFTSQDTQAYTGNVNFNNEEIANAAIMDAINISDNEYYNLVGKDGWWVSRMETDLQEGYVPEFINKEGKWFNKIKGISTVLNNIDTSEFTVQGIGQVSSVVEAPFEVDENEDDTQTDDPATIIGCMNPLATNYGGPDNTNGIYPPANTACSGCCEYENVGCNDPLDPSYGTNNDCTGYVNGCMDSTALNYDPQATQQLAVFEIEYWGITQTDVIYAPGLCIYDDESSDGEDPNNTPCADGYLMDGDGNCVEIVYGCMVSTALNYNSDANLPCQCTDPNVTGVDNNMLAPYNSTDNCFCCVYSNEDEEVYGCMDWGACNFDSSATINDGSCEFEACVTGCLDPYAPNYNEGCTSYDFFTQTYTETNCLNPCSDCCGDTDYSAIAGCMNELAINYDPNNVPLLSCEDAGLGCSDCQCCVFPWDDFDNDCAQLAVVDYQAALANEDCYGCTEPEAINYNPNAIFSVDPNTLEVINCQYEIVDEIFGCTDPSSYNYNPQAGTDDGSCVAFIVGCFDDTAFNYCPDCNTPCDDYLDQGNYDPNCCEPVVVGCLEEGMWNYQGPGNGLNLPVANTPCVDCCAGLFFGCMDNGLLDINNGDPYTSPYPGVMAVNYDPTALYETFSVAGLTYDCTFFGSCCEYPPEYTLNVKNLPDDMEGTTSGDNNSF